MNFNALFYSYSITEGLLQNSRYLKLHGRSTSELEVMIMFLGLEWYWWLVILAALAVSIPFKVRFMKWWNQREKEEKKEHHGKWGDDE